MIRIFELREVLEGLAARRAAANITDTQIQQLQGFFKQFKELPQIADVKAYAREDRCFHGFVTEVGAKEFLKSILQNYNIITYSYQVVSSEGLVRPPDETIREHLAVIEAICCRDTEAAENLMRQHLKKTIVTLKQQFETGKQDVRKSA